MQKLLLVALASAFAFSSAAQTGRVAHYSHGGRAATLVDEEVDNFGIHPMPVAQWEADTLTYQSDSVAIHSGSYKTFGTHGKPKTDWHREVQEIKYAGSNQAITSSSDTEITVNLLREWYPNTVFIGFDKLKKPAPKKAGFPKPAPRKSSGRIQAFPKRPFQYSYWHGLASAAALGAVGWLLGRKPGAKIG